MEVWGVYYVGNSEMASGEVASSPFGSKIEIRRPVLERNWRCTIGGCVKVDQGEVSECGGCTPPSEGKGREVGLVGTHASIPG